LEHIFYLEGLTFSNMNYAKEVQGGFEMRIGDIVTRRVFGSDEQFCILGFYTKQDSGERVAILAMLDPSSVIEARVEELSPASLRNIFALTTNIYTH